LPRIPLYPLYCNGGDSFWTLCARKMGIVKPVK
jgi:hypothetical protein